MGSALKKQRLDKKGNSKDTKKAIIPNRKHSEVEDVQEEKSLAEIESSSGEIAEEEAVEEGLSDLEMDDEIDVADVSSSESESENEEEIEGEDEESFPKLKKKKNLDDGSESFANAFTAIVGSKLKAYDRKDPILARNKVTLKKLESEKLENKAKRALLAEKKQLQDRFRIKQLLPSASEPEKVRETIEKEKKLKKIAQRGVVRLFNAVLSTQIKTNQEISKEKVGQSRKEELMNEISKEKFLDLVQAAGDS